MRRLLRSPVWGTTLLGLLLPLILVVGLGAATSTAEAAAAKVPKAPTALSPSGTAVNANPILSWARSAKAASYDVEVAPVADFSRTIYQVSTTNQRATPTNQLPMSQLWWRVRGRNAAGTSPWVTAAFVRTKLAGPVLKSPADGAVLPQPYAAPLLEWAPMTGATSYTVELDRSGAPDWVDSTVYDTRITSFVVPDPQENGVYAWRVRALLGEGQSTNPSVARVYTVGELAPVAGSDPNSGQDVEDIVFDWESVPGAVDYEIRVSTDDQFTPSTIIDSRVVVSTRYSPTTTYDVDDYWWQVRARTVRGTAKEWTAVPIRSFHRAWDPLPAAGADPNPQPDLYGAPRLVYPPNLSNVSGDLYYQWTPTRLASRYQVQVSTDQAFSNPNTCAITTQTTFVPRFNSGGECHPGLNAPLFWRVRAIDYPRGVNGFWSPIQRFSVQRSQVDQVSPPNGATVDVPTLTWDALAGAESYYVRVFNSGGTVQETTTFSTSWTPPAQLAPASGPYTWTVQAIDTEGLRTPLPVLGAGRTFNSTGVVPDTAAADLTLLSPLDNAVSPRFPALRWEPQPGAARYEVWVGDVGAPGVSPIGSNFTYPAATSTQQSDITAGNYRWFVRAFNASNTQIGVSGLGLFTIDNPPTVSGHAVALDGSGLASGSGCTRSLASSQICTGLTATPVLDWSPLADVSSYRVYLSRDRNFQNQMPGSPFTTSNTRWTPTEALPESQAGTAYFWFVRPCKTKTVCAPDPVFATHAFEKRSNIVVTHAVTDGANDITFDWDDYLATNQSAPYADPTTREQSGQAAQAYQVQVATSDAFSSLVDDITVDQSTYTSFNKLYPEGPLFWRVRAIDGAGNGLPWSNGPAFTKSSPTPAPVGPSGSSLVTEPFRWAPTEFSANYDLEVYKNGDVAASASNRVLTANVKQVSYTPTAPLAAGTTYVWRVRRRDASGNVGSWSDWAAYKVAGGAPVQISPAAGVWVPATGALYTWSAVQDASAYRFERRQAGVANAAEAVKTFATAWAPPESLPTGNWEWRVLALDTDGNIVAGSAWRSFRVDATPPTIKKVKPASPVKRKADLLLLFSEKVKGVGKKTVRLYLVGKKKPLRARVSMDKKGRKATLDPSSSLKLGKTYEVRIKPGIKDVAGNPLPPATYTVTAK